MDTDGRIVVVSPHCDDAVLGCAHLIATHPGSLVVTVFAGRPAVYPPLTVWDRAAGFRPGDDVVEARRSEDRAALAVLDATPIWLDFTDAQYGPSPSIEAIGDALERVLVDAKLPTAVIPLGLFHSDHHLAHEASLAVAARHPEIAWFAYEEAIYRRIAGLVDDRIDAIRARALTAEPAPLGVDGDVERKRRAIACYASQIRALTAPGYPGYADALEPERYWRLT